MVTVFEEMADTYKWLQPNSAHIMYAWHAAAIMAQIPPYIYIIEMCSVSTKIEVAQHNKALR